MGQQQPTGVVCLAGVGERERKELAHKLQKVTGWPDLEFDRDGRLRRGMLQPFGGSRRARSLLTTAITGGDTIVLEEANRNAEVVFSRALPARWKHETLNSSSAFVIQIDFADFEHVTGDRMALQSFDVGWVVLHEIDHIVNNSSDARLDNEIGECEDHINLMRRECNLPERAGYFSTLLPTSAESIFARRFVRLAFEKELDGSKRKYWLVWDAHLVGGLEQKEIASLR
jgi:hypothetical protein